MRLVQSRLITDDVVRLAGFYAALLEAPAALNEYYVEVPAGPVTVGFSKRTFAGCHGIGPGCGDAPRPRPGASILDFQVSDVDAQYERVIKLGVTSAAPPADQPWGSRTMMFADPDGNFINVFSPTVTGH